MPTFFPIMTAVYFNNTAPPFLKSSANIKLTLCHCQSFKYSFSYCHRMILSYLTFLVLYYLPLYGLSSRKYVNSCYLSNTAFPKAIPSVRNIFHHATISVHSLTSTNISGEILSTQQCPRF